MSNETAAQLSSFQLYLLFSPQKIYIDRYMSIIWFLIGFVGNPISFIIWIAPKMRRENSSAIYLAALSINDFVVLACVLIQDLQYAWNINVLRYYFCQIFMILSTSTQLFSPVLVLAFTIERWIAICYPFKRHTLCTPKKAMVVSIILFTFVLLYNTLNGFMWTYEPSIDSCVFQTIFENVSTIEKHYIWSTEIIFSGCVPLLILMFNILVIKEMYRITSGQSHKPIERNIENKDLTISKLKTQSSHSDRSFLFTTIMLLVVSFYLFVTTLPVGIMFALQQVITMPDENMAFSQIPLDPIWNSYFRMNIVKAIIDEVCISHYSLNIVIYILTGQTFRKKFFYKFFKLFSCCRISVYITNETLSMNRSDSAYEHNHIIHKSNDQTNTRRNRSVGNNVGVIKPY